MGQPLTRKSQNLTVRARLIYHRPPNTPIYRGALFRSSTSSLGHPDKSGCYAEKAKATLRYVSSGAGTPQLLTP
jgi:hypothetical protein